MPLYFPYCVNMLLKKKKKDEQHIPFVVSDGYSQID